MSIAERLADRFALIRGGKLLHTATAATGFFTILIATVLFLPSSSDPMTVGRPQRWACGP